MTSPGFGLRRFARRVWRGLIGTAPANGAVAAAPEPSPETLAPAPETAEPLAAEPIAPEPQAPPRADPLADWQRYAAALERELEGGAERAAPTIRHQIVLPPELTAAAVAQNPMAGVRFPPGDPAAPRATVIVPVYGQLALTKACVRSLAAHPSERVRAEVVLVDDGSPEDVAGAFTGVPGLTVLRQAENLGFLRTCNRAARLSDAAYVVFLNNDTLVTAGWLDALVATAEGDPSVGVVGAKLVYPNGTLQEAGGILWSDAGGWNYGRGKRADDPAYAYAREVDYCSGAALLVRRALFERLGGFDERFAPAYFEDSDLCMAARREGYRVVYQPRSVVIHREGGTGGTDVGSGVKHHQVLNQPVFRSKWREVLEREHPEHDAEHVEHAARRRQGARTVVMIDNYVPEPDRDSGSNKNARIIGLMRELGWHVIFVPENDLASQPYTGRLQQLGVEVVHATPEGPSQQTRVRAALRLADAVWIARPDVFRKFRALLEEFPELPVVYDTQDLHYVRAARELELRGDATPAEWEKQQAVKDEELEIGRTADVIVAITDVERETLEREGLDNVCVVPNVHVPAGRGLPFDRRSGLLFIGGYAHTPNVDAVEWLVHEIMPKVWAFDPAIVVTLLGSHPPAAVRALAEDPRVIVPGWVADVAPYFDAARVFVSPLRYGAGLKGKIGQSLEHGLPVVTTPIGAEGFGFTDGADASIAADAEAFARAVLRVYAGPDLWRRYADASAARLEPYLPAQVKRRVAAALERARERRAARLDTAAV